MKKNTLKTKSSWKRTQSNVLVNQGVPELDIRNSTTGEGFGAKAFAVGRNSKDGGNNTKRNSKDGEKNDEKEKPDDSNSEPSVIMNDWHSDCFVVVNTGESFPFYMTKWFYMLSCFLGFYPLVRILIKGGIGEMRYIYRKKAFPTEGKGYTFTQVRDC